MCKEDDDIKDRDSDKQSINEVIKVTNSDTLTQRNLPITVVLKRRRLKKKKRKERKEET